MTLYSMTLCPMAPCPMALCFKALCPMALCPYGPVPLWPCAPVALYPHGPVPLWPCGLKAPCPYVPYTLNSGYSVDRGPSCINRCSNCIDRGARCVHACNICICLVHESFQGAAWIFRSHQIGDLSVGRVDIQIMYTRHVPSCQMYLRHMHIRRMYICQSWAWVGIASSLRGRFVRVVFATELLEEASCITRGGE